MSVVTSHSNSIEGLFSHKIYLFEFKYWRVNSFSPVTFEGRYDHLKHLANNREHLWREKLRDSKDLVETRYCHKRRKYCIKTRIEEFSIERQEMMKLKATFSRTAICAG